MDKDLEKTFEIAAKAVSDHAWMSIPLVVGGILAYRCPEMIREFLSHRREMTQIKAAERRRQESVERRREKAASRRRRETS